mmetsp:Transcript_17987/g.37086  ORF Transcript_17987/g.37086 Transcript_17987/m.37086 type:complete len:214 (-) Transcript_17987:505-1146(-)
MKLLFENGTSRFLVGRRKENYLVAQSSGSQEGRIQRPRAIGSSQHQDTVLPRLRDIYSVHLVQKRRKNSRFGRASPATTSQTTTIGAAAIAKNGIDFIKKQNARGRSSSQMKGLTDHTFGFANVGRSVHLGRAERKECNARRPRSCSGERRFRAARWAMKQNASTGLQSQHCEFSGLQTRPLDGLPQGFFCSTGVSRNVVPGNLWRSCQCCIS